VSQTSSEATPTRRRRRTREDVEKRIVDAARQLFTERGYGATTTKEIARLADVSETLLFRYHGDKAALFDAVVIQPFQQLMDAFVDQFPDPTAAGAREASKTFTRQVYELFETNEGLFRALLTERIPSSEDAPRPLAGLDPFFRAAVVQVEQRYRAAGIAPPLDLAIGVRLGMGMIASSVLLRDHLFPDGRPDRSAIIRALEHIVFQSLSGPDPD